MYCRITGSGSEQFHARPWLNNSTRLSGMDWLWSAKRGTDGSQTRRWSKGVRKDRRRLPAEAWRNRSPTRHSMPHSCASLHEGAACSQRNASSSDNHRLQKEETGDKAEPHCQFRCGEPERGAGTAWLTGIVRFRALDAVRKAGREIPSDDPTLGDEAVE